MAIKALNLTHVRDYVCKDDDPSDPTVWKLGTLSSRDVGAIRDSVTRVSFNPRSAGSESDDNYTTTVERSKMDMEAVRRGLKGVENFIDPETNQPVSLKLVLRDVGGGVKKSVVPNEFLDRIPTDVLRELSEQIMGSNEMEPEAEGNSPEPSTDD